MSDRTDIQWSRAAKAWIKAKAKADLAATKLAKARAKILELAGDSSCNGAGVSAKRYYKAGGIDYSQIKELQSMDLDQYRKSGHWETRVEPQ
jgi:hypothetical protein